VEISPNPPTPAIPTPPLSENGKVVSGCGEVSNGIDSSESQKRLYKRRSWTEGREGRRGEDVGRTVNTLGAVHGHPIKAHDSLAT